MALFHIQWESLPGVHRPSIYIDYTLKMGIYMEVVSVVGSAYVLHNAIIARSNDRKEYVFNVALTPVS